MEPAHGQKYDGAVVAEACRKVWHQEHSKPAPVHLQHSRVDHPLYRFVEDVFAILKIDKINPSSAFDSRKKLLKKYRDKLKNINENLEEDPDEECSFLMTDFQG